MEATDIFEREYGVGSENFMTPITLGYFIVRNHNGFVLVAELSKGKSPLREGGICYGVTFVRMYPDGHTKRMGQPASDVFDSRILAQRHMQKFWRKSDDT